MGNLGDRMKSRLQPKVCYTWSRQRTRTGTLRQKTSRTMGLDLYRVYSIKPLSPSSWQGTHVDGCPWHMSDCSSFLPETDGAGDSVQSTNDIERLLAVVSWITADLCGEESVGVRAFVGLLNISGGYKNIAQPIPKVSTTIVEVHLLRGRRVVIASRLGPWSGL